MKKMLFSVVLAMFSNLYIYAQTEIDGLNEIGAPTNTSIDNPEQQEVDEDKWRIYASYKPGKIGDGDFNGIELGWNKPCTLSSSVPVCLEFTQNIQYWFASESGVKTWMLSLELANFGFSYKWSVSDNVVLSPHVRIAGRLNVLGKQKSDYFGSVNLFEDRKSGGAGWKSFQLNWNVGVDLEISKRAFFGIGYGSDFQKIAGDERLKSFAITLGIIL